MSAAVLGSHDVRLAGEGGRRWGSPRLMMRGRRPGSGLRAAGLGLVSPRLGWSRARLGPGSLASVSHSREGDTLRDGGGGQNGLRVVIVGG